MRLEQYEIQSSLWQKLVEHYTPKLATYRARLENPTTPEHERIALCWRIAGIKELFELAEPDRKK